jgi:hypothetical protein
VAAKYNDILYALFGDDAFNAKNTEIAKPYFNQFVRNIINNLWNTLDHRIKHSLSRAEVKQKEADALYQGVFNM